MQPFASERYQVIAPLGGGGMAEVLLALATGAEGFRKPVAIKRMLPHLAVNEDVARMFLAEARLAMHLHHQNIVSVFDVVRGPEGLYLVMELVDGWDLGAVLGHEAKARTWMPEPLAVYVAQQVANGLAHAYRKTENGKPIMAAHRDLTPSNVMVTADGEVKIADFGIAKVDTGQTEPGTFKGKIPYAAPEVIRGQPATHLSDQFSLGVVLHRLTSGQYPYGYSDNTVAFHEQLAKAGPPPCTGLSAECAQVVRTMLAKAPEDRFPNIDVAGHALARLLAKSGAVVGAPQLAHFLSSLQLPPPPSAKVPKDVPKPAPARPMKATPPLPVPVMEEPLGSWRPPPGGPQMDESGRVTGGPPVHRPARETELELEPGLGDEPLSTANEAASPGLQDRFGKMFGSEAAPAPSPSSAETETELRPRDSFGGYDPLPGNYGPRARKPITFSVTGWLLLVLLVAGGLGGAYVYFGPRELRAKYEDLTGPPTQAVLTVLSTPDGAQVRIGGKVVGNTPLMQENLYPRGAEVEVQVTMRGYKPWTGKLRGGEAVTLEAVLKK
ncbi:MAG TPA: protein kinase [Myxococcaceae bacterium]|nr:protein kinase [Myxococcaceae bacterium]